MRIDVLLGGLSGRTNRGFLGWSSCALIRRTGRPPALFDTAGFNERGTLLDELARRGVRPEDVGIVLLSHFHFDHVANYGLFRNAVYCLHELEVRHIADGRSRDLAVPREMYPALEGSGRLRVLTGSYGEVDGLRWAHAPGHTPGLFALLAECGGERWALASDAVKNRVELATGAASTTADPSAGAASIEMIRRYADIVVPGHDGLLRLERADGGLRISDAGRTRVEMTVDSPAGSAGARTIVVESGVAVGGPHCRRASGTNIKRNEHDSERHETENMKRSTRSARAERRERSGGERPDDGKEKGMNRQQMPAVLFGAVYFRKSNPPAEDWERDYAQAARDGMTLFRHWFLWGNIEVAPGRFDWSDYDIHMDLAAKYGIKTVIAEHITFAPEWLHRSHGHLLQIRADGSSSPNLMNGSSSTGGTSNGAAGSLDFNCEEAREYAGRFLRELVSRYKDHPAMYGYDVWNECNYPGDVGYGEATQRKFREWLQRKYADLRTLGRTWRRYSYADWEDVMAPTVMGPYPECLDWLQFRKDNFYELMQWRIDLIRSLDANNKITAHGTAASLNNMARGSDDWLAASKADSYGFTWVVARKGSAPWKQASAVDLVRAAARGKTFWHSEMQGGPLWLQPGVDGGAKEDCRIAQPEDIRIWNLVSLARGARGVLYLRWRSLLDGPLFGAFGLYGMDGLPNPRSAAAAEMAGWANAPAQRELFRSAPVRGDIGIAVVPESQLFNELMEQAGKGQFYTKCAWGAYRGFFDNHIRADWVLIDHIDDYRTLYLPYPVMLRQETADRLRRWVRDGGTLIAEGCPGYFDDHGRAGATQPNLGLADLFGAREDEVEFMPDLGARIAFRYGGQRVRGGLFRQSYKTAGGSAWARYEDGRIAAVEHAYGAGRTLLIGTYPSEAYFREQDKDTRAFFRDALAWSGVKPLVQVSVEGLQVVACDGAGGRYLWALNPGASDAEAVVAIDERFGPLSVIEALRGQWSGEAAGRALTIEVPAKDAVVLRLQ